MARYIVSEKLGKLLRAQWHDKIYDICLKVISDQGIVLGENHLAVSITFDRLMIDFSGYVFVFYNGNARDVGYELGLPTETLCDAMMEAQKELGKRELNRVTFKMPEDGIVVIPGFEKYICLPEERQELIKQVVVYARAKIIPLRTAPTIHSFADLTDVVEIVESTELQGEENEEFIPHG